MKQNILLDFFSDSVFPSFWRPYSLHTGFKDSERPLILKWFGGSIFPFRILGLMFAKIIPKEEQSDR